jgi:hypothetical protein
MVAQSISDACTCLTDSTARSLALNSPLERCIYRGVTPSRSCSKSMLVVVWPILNAREGASWKWARWYEAYQWRRAFDGHGFHSGALASGFELGRAFRGRIGPSGRTKLGKPDFRLGWMVTSRRLAVFDLAGRLRWSS